MDVTMEQQEQLDFQDGEYWVVEEIKDLSIRSGEVQLQIKWKGFYKEEPT